MSRTNKKKMLLTLSVCMGMSLSMSSVYANPEELLDEYSLDTVVVTANRVATPLSKTAANVSIITAKDIEENHFRDLSEALKSVNGVTVTEASMSRQDIVRLNGDDRVIVMVDGRRMNMDKGTATDRAGIDLKTIPSLANIDRIEIVKGTASVLYGTDAVGGVINIITKKGAKEYKSTIDISSGSWGMKNYEVATEGSEKDWSWFVTAGKSEQDYMKYKDFKTGDTKKMSNSNYDKNNFTLRLDKEINDSSSLTLNVEHMSDHSGQWYQAPGFGYSGWGGFVSNHYENDTMDKLMNNWAITYHFKEDTDIPGYFRYYSNYTSQGFNDVDGGSGYAEYSNHAKGFDWQDGWWLNENNKVIAGAEWRETRVINNGAGDYDEKINNKAIYLEDEITLSDHWTFTPGIRYDHHNMFGGKTTPKASFNYKFDESANAYISWGKIFNAPNADDLFWNQPAWMMYGNPNLKPETGDTVTIGFNKQLSQNTSLSTSAFRSNVKDAIRWNYDPNTYISTVENIDEQKRKGFEIALQSKLSEIWSIDVGYSYLSVENKQPNADYITDKNNSQPNGYRIGIHYNLDRWNVNLFGTAATGRNLNNFTSAGYWVWDANINYAVEDNLTAYLKVNNITNRDYELTPCAGSQGAYPMMGRNIQIGMKCTF